ncbi:hypothetical protein C4588_08220 [Candidatus Parcubacteria bacterium]|jgi:hypothetical protein|nr:MAG: hypothetical protein C4588_08220 [Candidatus Parcubacteria bacterium]
MIRISGFSNTCPICQDLRFEKIFSKAGFDFVTCEECSLIYITPKPIDEEINTIYSKDYYNPWGLDTDSSAVAEMKIATFDHKLAIVERYVNKVNVLDIGCATGFF